MATFETDFLFNNSDINRYFWQCQLCFPKTQYSFMVIEENWLKITENQSLSVLLYGKYTEQNNYVKSKKNIIKVVFKQI